MPTVLRWEGYRAFFYSNEGHEPPHVHVMSGAREAKFWLSNLEAAANRGFSGPELRRIRAKLNGSRVQLVEAWARYFDA